MPAIVGGMMHMGIGRIRSGMCVRPGMMMGMVMVMRQKLILRDDRPNAGKPASRLYGPKAELFPDFRAKIQSVSLCRQRRDALQGLLVMQIMRQMGAIVVAALAVQMGQTRQAHRRNIPL